MNGVSPRGESAPEIVLRQLAAERDGVTERWSIAWDIANQGKDSIEISGVRLPHGQFRSDEHRFDPPLNLAPGVNRQFHVFVSCDEPAGLVTENAFVIFTARWSGKAWRIFVRIRVVVNAAGKPETETQLITTQEVGFSDVASPARKRDGR
jgi:hypothetical protein